MDLQARLGTWFAARFPGTGEVTVEGLDRVERGHSAETLLLTIRRRDRHGDRRHEVVVRIRPPAPGLLEPYDMKRQFDILRALEPTPVRAPRALWLEPTGGVLGREFYVMERLPGTVFERGVPAELAADPDRVRRMCEGLVEQIAAIHTVDLEKTGLAELGDGRRYLEFELQHWSEEIRRFQPGPLPALERLVTALREKQPEACPSVTLVHGDAKPGNFAFEGAEVTGVFDWEMASIGDPLADIGWAEILWPSPGYFTSVPGALSTDEFVARWEELTGIRARHRCWYRAFQALKMAVILFVGGQLFDAAHSDDLRLAEMAHAVHPVTEAGLRELGIAERVEPGPVLPRPGRVHEVKEAQRS
jgi:aminoglycoside phosphotransferase (APT) family kinase protein